MYNSYVLRIATNINNYIALNEIFEINVDQNHHAYWEYEIETNDQFHNAIETITDILHANKDKILNLGISSNEIVLWLFYGYEEQCNMEFSPQDIKNLSTIGITFCISCWNEG
jgi:hypothetical protein